VATTAKRLTYSASLERDGAMLAEGRAPIRTPHGWTSEHLVLAALARCALASLRYHARRAGLTLEASARADGVVTRREGDGRYALVDVRIEAEVELTPSQPPEVIADLFARAERGCFVGASLTASPIYDWRVRGPSSQAPRTDPSSDGARGGGLSAPRPRGGGRAGRALHASDRGRGRE
jgi:organic hydroperoxide reductase OsmC/OhrA